MLKKRKKNKHPKVMIVMPAYKAARTVKKTYMDIPKNLRQHVLLVDDASPDETVKTAKKLGIATIRLNHNKGYGGNQKKCYQMALKSDVDVVVLLHPDHQYDPKQIANLIKPILSGSADFTFGSRFAGKKDPRKGGMPWYRYYGNRYTTAVENFFMGTKYSEFHSGFKAYNRYFLSNISFRMYSNGFFFDTQMVVDAILSGFRVKEVQIPTRYNDESSSIGIIPSFVYVFQTIAYVAYKSTQKNIKNILRKS